MQNCNQLTVIDKMIILFSSQHSQINVHDQLRGVLRLQNQYTSMKAM